MTALSHSQCSIVTSYDVTICIGGGQAHLTGHEPIHTHTARCVVLRHFHFTTAAPLAPHPNIVLVTLN